MADEIDIYSATWRAIRAHCETEIAAAQTRNEEIGLPQPQTDAIRGTIAALRSVLAQDKSNQPEILEGPGNVLKR